MTLTQLEYFIAVAEVGSINATANFFFISQSALSSAMRELEDELGATLFNRTNRGVSLTTDGEEFMVYARNVIVQYRLLNERFSHSENKDKYHFSVSMHHSTFAAGCFAQIIKEFGIEKYTYSIYETNTTRVIEDVSVGKSELGLLYVSNFGEGIYKKSFAKSNLLFFEMNECPVYVYLGKNHPLSDKKILSLSDLESYPCLLFEQGNDSLYFYEEIISEYQYKNVIKTSDRGTSMDILQNSDAYSVGLGKISEGSFASDIIAIKLESNERIKVGYLVKENEKLSLLGERFVEMIKNYFK